jgi:hypothetical protein
MSGCASTTGPSADAVTEIRQERDCSGCETGSVVTLRRGGAATLVQTGKARFGTTDRSFTGAVSAADFERLAALLAARGFFEMRDEYRDPDLADGAWVTTTAVADGRTKNVFDGNEAGPAPLREIEDAIEALRARIDWVPVPP